jgi:hypothetical protein
MKKYLLPFVSLILLACQDESEPISEAEANIQELINSEETTMDESEMADEVLGEIDEEMELMDEIMYSNPISKEVLVCNIGQYQDIAVMVLNHYSDDGMGAEPIDGYYFYLKHHKNLDLKGQMAFHPYYYSLNEYYKGKQSGFMEFTRSKDDETDVYNSYWTTNRTNGTGQKFNKVSLINTSEENHYVSVVNGRYAKKHQVMDMTMPEGENLTDVEDQLNMTLINDEYLVFDYSVTRTNYHLGSIEGIAYLQADDSFLFEGEEGCQLTFKLDGNEIEAIDDDNSCDYYGGANVYFSGALQKK